MFEKRMLTVATAAITALAIVPMTQAQQIQVTRQQVQAATAQQQIAAGDPRTPIHSIPFTITECGSYYLTGCRSGVSGQNGITVDASNVVLDLNGFTLSGVPGSLDGIHVNTGRKNVKTCNGSVKEWGGDGIEWGGGRGVILELDCSGNGGDGVKGDANAKNVRVDRCRMSGNGGNGFWWSGRNSWVFMTEVESNTLNGFELTPLTSGVTLERCRAASPTLPAFKASGLDNLMLTCEAFVNTQPGTMRLTSWSGIGGQVKDCRMSGAQGDGLHVEPGSSDTRIEGNNVTNCGGTGVRVEGTNNVVIKNTASNNGTNYNVMPGNDAGPISPASTATSCWANISN
jgi:parallel beta-helix repeat protein